jgi:hypothetical protein
VFASHSASFQFLKGKNIRGNYEHLLMLDTAQLRARCQRHLEYVLRPGRDSLGCSDCRVELKNLAHEQASSSAAAKETQDRVVRAAVSQGRGAMDVGAGDDLNANQRAAAKLHQECKHPKDPLLLEAVVTAIKELPVTQRLVGDAEKRALCHLLECEHCWSVEYMLQATRQAQLEMSTLFRWYDEFINAVLVFHDAIRSANHELITACRKKLLIVFLLSNNTQYIRLTAAELIKLEHQLEAEVVRFFRQMQLANLSGVSAKFQGSDAIVEEFIRRLLRLVHSGDSERRWDAAQHDMLTSERKEETLASSLALPPRSEVRRQREMWSMEAEVKKATELFRVHTMTIGPPRTLGGKRLTKEALRLEELGTERLVTFHAEHVVGGGGKMWGKKWTADLAKTPRLVETKAESKEAKSSSAPRSNKRKRDVSSPFVMLSLMFCW